MGVAESHLKLAGLPGDLHNFRGRRQAVGIRRQGDNQRVGQPPPAGCPIHFGIGHSHAGLGRGFEKMKQRQIERAPVLEIRPQKIMRGFEVGLISPGIAGFEVKRQNAACGDFLGPLEFIIHPEQRLAVPIFEELRIGNERRRTVVHGPARVTAEQQIGRVGIAVDAALLWRGRIGAHRHQQDHEQEKKQPPAHAQSDP